MNQREMIQLQNRVAELERIAKQLVQPKSQARLMISSSKAYHFMTPVGGIDGMTGLQMASASCERHDCDSAGLLSASGEEDDVFNPVAGAIAGDTLIVAMRNSAGLLVAIVEDCGA